MTDRVPPAAAVVPLAAGIGIGAAYAEPVLLAAVLGTQVLAALAWSAAIGRPGARGAAAVACGAAVAADVALLTDGDDDRPLGRLAAVLGLVVVAAIGQQLLRAAPRPAVTGSFATTVTTAATCVLGAAHLALPQVRYGGALAVAATLPVAAVVVPLALPALAGRRRHPVAVAAGLLTALVVALLAAGPAVGLLLVGAAAAGVGWLGTLLAARSSEQSSVAGDLAAGSLPLLLAGPAAYVLGRLVVG